MTTTPPPAPGTEPERQGFFAALFDFSFATLVTPRIIKVVYAIAMVAIGLFYLFLIGAGFSQSGTSGVLALIGGGIGALLYLVLFRMLLEFYMATFRIAENTSRMADAMERRP